MSCLEKRRTTTEGSSWKRTVDEKLSIERERVESELLESES